MVQSSTAPQLDVDPSRLLDEVRALDDALKQVLGELVGEQAVTLVEDVRRLAQRRRAGDLDAERSLVARLAEADEPSLEVLIQALSLHFDLANLSEDRHRVRVLRERERRRHPEPRAESIADAVERLKAGGVNARAMQALLKRLDIELVFTAHPTEAKRKSLREKIRDLRSHMQQLDDPDLLPRERERLWERVRGDLVALWQTDFLRERRPMVLEEVNRSLFFATTLWEVLPRLYDDLREAVAAAYPDESVHVPTFLRFATWIGGDRDGNPNVTAEVTERSLAAMRDAALKQHLLQCRAVRRSLSISDGRATISPQLIKAYDVARHTWPHLAEVIAPISSRETCRRWLRIVQWRLEQTQRVRPFEAMPEGAYASAMELRHDLELIQETLRANRGGRSMESRLREWICQIDVFGFHLMRLDVRQESSWYHGVMGEILAKAGVAENYAQMDEAERQAVLTRSMPFTGAFDEASLSEEASEALALFRVLAETVTISGEASLGALIVSMTHEPSDVLVVLWLSHWAGARAGLDGALPMPIVPLFETIRDLRRAPATLAAMLDHPAWSEQVSLDGGRQIIMIGYSDSTKDGGYLTACWELQQAQTALAEMARKRGVRPVFFHGRGGSLGRGGGPAARGILSLPRETVGGALRITEQGEVLAERYDDPQVAHRHLEQVTWATLLVSAAPATEVDAAWHDAMRRLSGLAFAHYRELVDLPGFIDYFEQATPITEIERLPIGSRPARRGGQRSLGSLRAIPWVFSWTQCRHMIPAWYGLGAALDALTSEGDAASDLLREMYEKWSFFRATIDNAELALAKADLDIGRQYASLVDDAAARESVWGRIETEHARSRDAVLAITGGEALLDSVPWLKRSIAVRNPYVDPLNFIQIRLFRTVRECAEQDEASRERLRHLIRLSIQGIASGLRTTG